jgi:lipopolysaccharide export system protein LptA
MRTTFSILGVVAALAAVIFFGSLEAQVPPDVRVGKGFSIPYHEETELKALFTGQEAKPLPGGKIFVTQFGMKTFRDGDKEKIELIIEAPECVFDRSSFTASSPGALRVSTPATNFVISGEGFLCQQTNSFLVISNDVRTILQKDAQAWRKTPPQPPSPSPAPTETVVPPARSLPPEILTIDADHFEFLYASNIVTYTRNVRVNDPEMDLQSEFLEIRFTTNNTVETVLVETNVVIDLQQHQSQARGQHALYIMNAEEELVRLTGNPTWKDTERESTADIFIFDRRHNRIHAQTNAWLKLPEQAIGRPALPAAAAPAEVPPAKAKEAAPRFMELFAGRFSIQLPETNGPIQQIIAEENVLIVNPAEQSRATADHATYYENTGLLMLTGGARWQFNQQEVRGEILTVSRDTRALSGRGNVYLRLPAQTLGKRFGMSQPATNAAPAQPGFLEVFAQDFIYENDTAVFRGNVRADFTETDGLFTTLLCGTLKLTFNASNEVQHVLASENVFVQQKPVNLGTNGVLSKSLSCEWLEAERSPAGMFRWMEAEQNAVVEQIERVSPGGHLVYKRLSAEILRMLFATHTNQVEQVIAEVNVLAEQVEHLPEGKKVSQAAGDKLVYLLTPGAEKIEITGNAVARASGVIITDSEVLIWDPKTGKMRARGPFKIDPEEGSRGFQVSVPRK